MKSKSRFLQLLAVTLTLIVTSTGARAQALFWAVDNFRTANQINGDTGAVVDSFSLPSGASLAVVGNTGYYTKLNDANVYTVDMTTHVLGAIAFNTGLSSNMNSLTVDSDQHLWFGHGGSGASNVLQEFTTSGTLLSTHAFPTASSSYRDGLVVYGGFAVANRGDQVGPYDKYLLPSAANDPLSYVLPAPGTPFINANLGGNNGIAFNGVNFYVSNEQIHVVTKWDINGNFVSQANLPSNSRYENWTFASQAIIPPPVTGAVPEPSTYGLMGVAALGLFVAIRRRRSNAA